MKIEIEVEDIDYDNLVDQYLPLMTDKLRESRNPVALLISNGMPSSLAKTVLRGLSQDKKDEIVAEMINTNSNVIKEKVSEFASQNKVKVKIKKVFASTF